MQIELILAPFWAHGMENPTQKIMFGFYYFFPDLLMVTGGLGAPWNRTDYFQQ